MEFFFFFFPITWLVLSGAAAAYASNKGRSGIGIFFLSLFLSPLVGFFGRCRDGTCQQKVAPARIGWRILCAPGRRTRNDTVARMAVTP